MDELDKWIKMRKEDPGGFKDFAKRTIEEITEVSNGNIESDLSLRLITPNCQLWGRGLEESPIPDPYWAFHWLGGQALTRYLIRHKKIIEDKTVLDFGCGGGALAITAAKLGTATSVTAIDIDPFAAVATEMNAELNGVDPKSIKIIIDDIVEQPLYKYDVIFVGDMLYDFRKSHEIMYWFVRSLKPGVQIFLGDPGRSPTIIEEFECNLKRVAKYEISKDEVELNNLVGNVNSVWKFVKPIDYKEYFKGLFRICVA